MKNTDLFETPELLPDHIKAILDTFDVETLSYSDCQSMLAQMEKLGHTFEFGLDAVPFNLRISENQPTKVKVKFVYTKEWKEVTAVFIDEKNPQLPDCYSHIGQHSICSIDWVKEQKKSY
jgi:hypothetical protein